MEKKGPPPLGKKKTPPPKSTAKPPAAKGAGAAPPAEGTTPAGAAKKIGLPPPPSGGSAATKASLPGAKGTSPSPLSSGDPSGGKPSLPQKAPNPGGSAADGAPPGDAPKLPAPSKSMPPKGSPLPGKKGSVVVGKGPPSGPPKKAGIPGSSGPPDAGTSSPVQAPKKELPKVLPASPKGLPSPAGMSPLSPGSPKGLPPAAGLGKPSPGVGLAKPKLETLKKSGIPLKAGEPKELGMGSKDVAVKKMGLLTGPATPTAPVKSLLPKPGAVSLPGAKGAGPLGATPPSLPKPPLAKPGTPGTQASDNVDEHGVRRGSCGKLSPESNLEKESSGMTLQSIFTRNGDFVGKASGPAEPLAAKDRPAQPADRGRSRMRHQDHAAADRVPRAARSAQVDRSSRRTPDLLSFFPLPGSMDGLPGFFVPVPAWPPPDQEKFASASPPFPFPPGSRPPGMAMRGFPYLPCPPAPYGPYAPYAPYAPPLPYPQPGVAWDALSGAAPYYPPAGVPFPPHPPAPHGASSMGAPRHPAAAAPGRVATPEDSGEAEGSGTGDAPKNGGSQPQVVADRARGREGAGDRVTFALQHRGKDGGKGAGSTRNERRRRRSTVLQLLEDAGLEPSRDCLRALKERDDQDAMEDKRWNTEEWSPGMPCDGGPSARAYIGGSNKAIGATPWETIEKSLNYIRSGAHRVRLGGDDETLPARLPEEERSFDPAVFAKGRKEREARGEDPTFGAQAGDDYYKYFDPHYTPSKKPWYNEAVPRTTPPMPARHEYGSVPRGGKFSSKPPKGWDRWGFERGLTAPRKRTYQSLNELATYFTHLDSEDQDEIVNLLLLCRKLEQQVEQQHVVIDMLEHDLTTANAALKFPPEWRALDEIDLVSLVPADSAFQPSTATPLFLKRATLLPSSVTLEAVASASPQAAEAPAGAPKAAEATKTAPATAAKPAGATVTKAPGIKAPGAGKKPVFKTTIKAAK
uniref:Uncharacterized protein n=1 Tax=Neospora caninum (strain Liverpool) TaxID=572307 RepID=A0A0F7U5A0_NEOCL|nr:TPA: hypothetical protein BN1204_008010 [Neospora caninum Liverpool]